MLVDPSAIFMVVPDYLVDKIYYEVSGSQLVTGGAPGDSPQIFPLPQTKGEAFFTNMQFSTDQINWYSSSYPPYDYNVTFAEYTATFTGALSCDASDVYVYLFSLEVNRTIYYRLVGFSIG